MRLLARHVHGRVWCHELLRETESSAVGQQCERIMAMQFAVSEVGSNDEKDLRFQPL